MQATVTVGAGKGRELFFTRVDVSVGSPADIRARLKYPNPN